MDSGAPPPVLVGVDGSPGSLRAAGTAAETARRRGVGLWLMCPAHGRPAEPPAPVQSRSAWHHVGDPDALLDRVAADLRARWPGLDVTARAAGGDLCALLVDRSPTAGLLVVDAAHTGGYDPVADRWLDHRVVTRAHCPVLIAGAARTGPVVVGIDGSEHAAAAVPLAFAEADERGVALLAVNVHFIGPREGCLVTAGDGYSAPVAQACAADLVAHVLTGWADKYPRVVVERQARYAPDVADALVEASGSAGLVVVGSRGPGAVVAGRRLGSVCATLLRRACCPVLLTRAYLT